MKVDILRGGIIMADKMRPVPFVNLFDRIVGEYRNEGSIFSIHESEFYTPSGDKSVNVFSQKCVTPLGPAAGPHTQLAQNIIAAYLTGSRFIELKTVQIMDTLEIAKPCIDARDEGYNVEWSTEYTLPKAYDEYLKAWIILHIIETLQNKGSFESPSFIFNMSVGYNLEGIKTERMQKFINSMLDADVDGRFDGYIEDVKRVFVKGYLDGTPWAGLEESVVAMLPKISKRISPSVTTSQTQAHSLMVCSSHLLHALPMIRAISQAQASSSSRRAKSFGSTLISLRTT